MSLFKITYELAPEIRNRVSADARGLVKIVNMVGENAIRIFKVEALEFIHPIQISGNSFAISTSLIKLQLNGVVIKGLFNQLCFSTHLKELDLSELDIDSQEAEQLANYLKSTTVLESLMIQKSLYSFEFEKVSVGLQSNRSIRLLDLNENYDFFECIKGLSNLIKYNTSMTDLKLPVLRNGNPHLLADAFLLNKTIQRLSCRGEYPEFVVQLMNGLLASPSLQRVFTDEDGFNVTLIKTRNTLNAVLEQNSIKLNNNSSRLATDSV